MVSVAKVELYGENNGGQIRRLTVANGTGITKNKVLTLTDPRTCTEVSAVPDSKGYPCAGFSAAEKVASDGQVELGGWTQGVFEVSASGTIALGQAVKSVGTGYFAAALINDFASGVVCGYSLETVSDLEIFNMRLNL